MIESTPPAEPRRPGIWGGIGIVALYFVLQLFVAVALAFVIGIVYGMMGGLQGHKVSPTAMMQLFHSPDVKTGLTVATIALVAVLMLWIVHRTWRGQWRVADPPGFGFVLPARNAWFVYAVLAGLAVAIIGGVLTHLLAHGHKIHQDVAVMGHQVTLGVRLALAVLVVCVAPVVEELIFRGVLLSGLMRRMQAGWAVLVTALVFGCVHLPDFKFAWYAIPTLVLLGVVLGWLRLRSRSLWPAVTAHAANNLLAVIGWFAATHVHP